MTVTTLFLDVGGVLLTNGWDHTLRQAASAKFSLDPQEFERRHALLNGPYEEDRISMDEYFNFLVFYEPRPFTKSDFKEFIFHASKPYQEMIDWIKEIKQAYHLKVAVVSNEARTLTEYRIQEFNLREFVDFFCVSCFMHCRKPDPTIFQYALDLCQAPPAEIVYIDDRKLLIDVAKSYGIRGIVHRDLQTTKEIFNSYL